MKKSKVFKIKNYSITTKIRWKVGVSMSESLFIKQMSALSEPTRLKIVYILSLQSFCAMHLEEIIGVSQSNVSRHVDKLLSSKIVTMEKVGRRKIYSLDPKFIEENTQILML